jgi:CRP/FNR family transcriptional regulator, cyclic AMP receptor protein
MGLTEPTGASTTEGAMQRPAAPAPNDELMRFLVRQPLFADLPTADLAPLAAVVRRRHYLRGAVIFTQGDLGNVAFIVRSGRVEIVVESADGRDLVLYEVGPGDHFGEMALLEGQPRSASAVCAEASELLAITREDLLGELERHPSIMLRMLQAMSRRLRLTDRRLEGLAFHDAAIRLAETLWRISQTDGALRVARIHQDDLAARVGVSRQTVNRVLGEWRRRGLVSVARGEIRLPDPDRFTAWRAELAAAANEG